MDNIIEMINKQRIAQHFLTIEETLALTKNNNQILDVFSTLIDRDAKIGSFNCFHPNVVIVGNVSIGDYNYFSNGTSIQAMNDKIKIGSFCRFDGKINLYYQCHIGDGAQLIGFIQAYSCTLKGGGSYKEKDADLRGAVLKGTGRAKNLIVEKGHVINGCGDFKQENQEWQHVYHPRPIEFNE